MQLQFLLALLQWFLIAGTATRNGWLWRGQQGGQSYGTGLKQEQIQVIQPVKEMLSIQKKSVKSRVESEGGIVHCLFQD